MALNTEDYREPVCPFDVSQWKDEPPKTSIPTGRVIEKLDQLYNRSDYQGAIRLANYWIEEAERGRDAEGEFALRNELMGIYRKIGQKDQALKNADLALAGVLNTPKTALPLPVISAASAPFSFSRRTAWLISGRIRAETGSSTLLRLRRSRERSPVFRASTA